MVEKFDNFELLIFFALYIAKQDNLSKVEYQTLIDDIPSSRTFILKTMENIYIQMPLKL